VGSSWYTPLGTSVLAGRVRGGVIGPFGRANQFTPQGTEPTDSQVERVPLENRFRLGGVNSIRGFHENSLPPTGGLAMFLANLELRVPLFGPFGMELFADAGNVWARPSYIKASHFAVRTERALPDPGDLRYVFGVGARLNLPFGPLRLDATLLPRPENSKQFATLQFAIGPAF
jgi:translocation and assembly module TamA